MKPRNINYAGKAQDPQKAIHRNAQLEDCEYIVVDTKGRMHFYYSEEAAHRKYRHYIPSDIFRRLSCMDD